MPPSSLICEAIRKRLRLEFVYHGCARVFEPDCHGISARGTELLRAIQVRGESDSGKFGIGKLWTVGDMQGVRVLDEHFEANDPNYNPDDSAMKQIHCRIPSRSR